MAEGINLGKAYVQIMPSAEGIQGSISGLLAGEAESAGKSSGGKFSAAMGGVLKTGLGLAATGAAAVTSFAKSIVDGAKNTASMGDTVDKMSQKLGLSAKAYQEWDYVLSQSGADITSMSTGLKTLTNKLDDAKNGSEKAQSMFAALGLSLEDITSMSREDAFAAVIAGFQGMTDSTERAALANDLFGRSGQELTPLFNTSIEQTEALMQTANDLGMVMSDTAVKDAAAFTDAMDNLSRAADGAKNQLSANFLPGLAEVTNGLAGLIAGTDGAANQITKGFNQIVDGIKKALPGIVDTISGLAKSLAEVAPTLIQTLATALISSIPELLPAATDLILQLAEMLISMAPQLIEVGLQVILQLVLGIADALPNLIPAAVDAILAIVDALIDNIDLLVDASIAITIALAEGLINALPKLIEKAPEIVTKLVEALIRNAPKLLEAAFELVVKLVEGIVNNLPQIAHAAGEIIATLLAGIGNLFVSIYNTGKEIGENIKNGFSEFISNAGTWGRDLINNFVDGIWSKIGDVIDAAMSVANTVRDYLGFSEPDKGPLANFHTFAPDMMGLFAAGIDQNVGIVMNSVDKLGNSLSDAFDSSINDAVFDVSANMSSVGHQSVGSSVNMGGVTIQVYGAPGMDETYLAQQISNILNRQYVNARAVFA